MNVDLATPFTAVLSLSMLGFTGVSAIVQFTSVDRVTGTAEWSAPVVPGETVMLQWQFHKRGECIGTNGRIWEGADGFFLAEPAKQNALPESAVPIQPIIPTEIPRIAPDGPLTMWIVGFCELSNGRHEEFRLGPVKFTVRSDG